MAPAILWCIAVLLLSPCLLASALVIANGRIARDVANNYYLNTAPQRSDSIYCSAKPGAFSSGCPSQSCSTNYDCEIRDVRLRCVCDRELCGSVCVSLDAHCKFLDDVRNGNKTRALDYGNENMVGQTVTYMCNPGYSLVGERSVTCKANLEWTVPKERRGRCISATRSATSCGPPTTLPHTVLDPSPDLRTTVYSAGDTFRYTCAPGYSAMAPGLTVTAVCTDGQWNFRDIACSLISCGDPGTPINGRHLNRNYTFGQKVSYFCNEGYKIECPVHSPGCQVRTCESSGHWSGNLPSCNPVRCPSLGNPENGYTKAGRNTINSVAEYSCNPGYRLNGHNKRLCRRDGTWDGSDPTCSVQDCGQPPFVPNSKRPVYTGTTFGTSVTYSCMEDTKFEGENGGRIVCQNSGQWLPAPPRCRKHCDAPTIPNARVFIGRAGGPEAIGKVPSDTTLLVQCRDEFQLKTVLYPRCDNGSWTRIPECVPKDCNDRPPIVKNGIARFYSTRHNDRAVYSCYVGYELSAGTGTVTCRYGKWTGALPACTKKRCPWIQSDPNVAKWLIGPEGQKNPWTRKETLSDNEELVKFECTQKGHVLRGHTHAICLNGRWSPPGSASCVPQMHKQIPTDWLFYRRG